MVPHYVLPPRINYPLLAGQGWSAVEGIAPTCHTEEPCHAERSEASQRPARETLQRHAIAPRLPSHSLSSSPYYKLPIQRRDEIHQAFALFSKEDICKQSSLNRNAL
jgi:hypothetical protein